MPTKSINLIQLKREPQDYVASKINVFSEDGVRSVISDNVEFVRREIVPYSQAVVAGLVDGLSGDINIDAIVDGFGDVITTDEISDLIDYINATGVTDTLLDDVGEIVGDYTVTLDVIAGAVDDENVSSIFPDGFDVAAVQDVASYSGNIPAAFIAGGFTFLQHFYRSKIGIENVLDYLLTDRASKLLNSVLYLSSNEVYGNNSFFGDLGGVTVNYENYTGIHISTLSIVDSMTFYDSNGSMVSSWSESSTFNYSFNINVYTDSDGLVENLSSSFFWGLLTYIVDGEVASHYRAYNRIYSIFTNSDYRYMFGHISALTNAIDASLEASSNNDYSNLRIGDLSAEDLNTYLASAFSAYPIHSLRFAFIKYMRENRDELEDVPVRVFNMTSLSFCKMLRIDSTRVDPDGGYYNVLDAFLSDYSYGSYNTNVNLVCERYIDAVTLFMSILNSRHGDVVGIDLSDNSLTTINMRELPESTNATPSQRHITFYILFMVTLLSKLGFGSRDIPFRETFLFTSSKIMDVDRFYQFNNILDWSTMAEVLTASDSLDIWQTRSINEIYYTEELFGAVKTRAYVVEALAAMQEYVNARNAPLNAQPYALYIGSSLGTRFMSGNLSVLSPEHCGRLAADLTFFYDDYLHGTYVSAVSDSLSVFDYPQTAFSDETVALLQEYIVQITAHLPVTVTPTVSNEADGTIATVATDTSMTQTVYMSSLSNAAYAQYGELLQQPAWKSTMWSTDFVSTINRNSAPMHVKIGPLANSKFNGGTPSMPGRASNGVYLEDDGTFTTAFRTQLGFHIPFGFLTTVPYSATDMDVTGLTFQFNTVLCGKSTDLQTLIARHVGDGNVELHYIHSVNVPYEISMSEKNVWSYNIGGLYAHAAGQPSAASSTGYLWDYSDVGSSYPDKFESFTGAQIPVFSSSTTLGKEQLYPNSSLHKPTGTVYFVSAIENADKDELTVTYYSRQLNLNTDNYMDPHEMNVADTFTTIRQHNIANYTGYDDPSSSSPLQERSRHTSVYYADDDQLNEGYPLYYGYLVGGTLIFYSDGSDSHVANSNPLTMDLHRDTPQSTHIWTIEQQAAIINIPNYRDSHSGMPNIVIVSGGLPYSGSKGHVRLQARQLPYEGDTYSPTFDDIIDITIEEDDSGFAREFWVTDGYLTVASTNRLYLYRLKLSGTELLTESNFYEKIAVYDVSVMKSNILEPGYTSGRLGCGYVYLNPVAAISYLEDTVGNGYPLIGGQLMAYGKGLNTSQYNYQRFTVNGYNTV